MTVQASLGHLRVERSSELQFYPEKRYRSSQFESKLARSVISRQVALEIPVVFSCRNVLELRFQQTDDLFEPELVSGVEGREVFTVDVEDCVYIVAV